MGHETVPDNGMWGRHALGEDIAFEVGPLTVRLHTENDELWISEERSGGRVAEGTAGDPAAVVDQSGLVWTRWAGPSSDEVIVTPVFPDRAVVVSPETAFNLSPGAEARIFVRIPLWVRLTFAEAEDVPLLEAPTVVMSDTWWGDFASGDLAYWLPTTARRRISDDLLRPHLVVCPLDLVNESREILPVEKLSVRVTNMPIFQASSGLWSAPTRVTYEAVDEGSRVDIGKRPPKEAAQARLLTPARVEPARGLRASTFGRFMSLAGL